MDIGTYCLINGSLGKLIKQDSSKRIFVFVDFPYFRVYPQDYKTHQIEELLPSDVFLKVLIENAQLFTPTFSFDVWKKSVDEYVDECVSLYDDAGDEDVLDSSQILSLSKALVRPTIWTHNLIAARKCLEYADFFEFSFDDLQQYMSTIPSLNTYYWQKVLLASSFYALTMVVVRKATKKLSDIY